MAGSKLTSQKRRRVALLIETSNAYGRGLLRGIRAYTRRHGGWSTYLVEQSRGQALPAWVKHWQGDGIIARIETPAIAKTVKAANLPTVDVSAARLIESLPWIETDDAKIASLAVQHLLERGFKRLAYCGDDRFNWSRWRCEQFVALTEQAGCRCEVLNTPAGAPDPDREMQTLADWLSTLGQPVGVMACYDIRGRQLIDACRGLGLAVPDDVAVLGVDNDDLLCDLTDPPLSSVAPDAERAGHHAAALLNRMLTGEAIEPGYCERIEPRGVAARRSTDVLAIEDPEVSAAMRFIRQHACEGINVADVLEQVPLSRRVLEARFKKLLGRTPHEQIVRFQLQRARQLLTETDLPLSQIAATCGFRHAEYFSVAFKKHEGLAPSAYRRSREQDQ